MKEGLYRVIEGDDILIIPEDRSEPLVEGIMNHNDYIMLVAEEKVGKTILAQQLACNLTKGTPFLGIFDITKPCKVWYFATEGREDDLKDRFIRMNKGVPVDTSMLKLIPSSFRFNTNEGFRCLKELIDKYSDDLPQVIIIDALYRAIKGSIRNDEVVNEFHHAVGWLSMQCDCAVVVTHHMTKPQRTPEGAYMDRSDKDTYGSAFLLAAVDHCLWLEKWKKDKEFKKDRFLRCDTQRSGSVATDIRLRLFEPDPLMFRVVSKHQEEEHKITQLLKGSPNGMNVLDLMVKSRVGRTTLYSVLKDLQNQGLVDKTGKKEKTYRWVPPLMDASIK